MDQPPAALPQLQVSEVMAIVQDLSDQMDAIDEQKELLKGLYEKLKEDPRVDMKLIKELVKYYRMKKEDFAALETRVHLFAKLQVSK